MKTTRFLNRFLSAALCSSILIVLTGCVAYTTVDGVKPVYPKAGTKEQLWSVARVNSLHPELKWSGKVAGQTYDLVLWDTVPGKDINGITVRKPRKIIYHKTGLIGTTHTVEILLEPSTSYYWSVRETGSEKWSTVTFFAAGPYGSSREHKFFQFYTPPLQELDKKLKK